jgi:hypothetical protein
MIIWRGNNTYKHELRRIRFNSPFLNPSVVAGLPIFSSLRVIFIPTLNFFMTSAFRCWFSILINILINNHRKFIYATSSGLHLCIICTQCKKETNNGEPLCQSPYYRPKLLNGFRLNFVLGTHLKSCMRVKFWFILIQCNYKISVYFSR